MKRLPIRARVTLVFTAATALVLCALGLFLYVRFEAQLNHAIEQGLRSRAQDLTAALRESESNRLQLTAPNGLIERDESFAQVLTPQGQTLDSTSQVGHQQVLSAPEVAEASARTRSFQKNGLAGVDGDARLLATPVEARAQKLVLVVGSALGDRDQSLHALAKLLILGGLGALLLTSLGGYVASGLAVRPVRAALERERSFVDDASHELRTPLAAQKTELELALRQGESPEQLRGAIESAVEETDRLSQLAEDLLVIARSEKGKLAVKTAPVEIETLFETVRQRLSDRAGTAGREIVVDGDRDTVVDADRLRLEQAVTNLAENALRYGQGQIRLWSRANGKAVELHVSDAGPGFPADFLPRAFERFSRADLARGAGGSGLGLAIVEAIARAHGGMAHATNDPGGGADVWVELPVRAPR